MMLQWNLLNVKSFLEMVECCKAPVEWVMADGTCDLTQSEAARETLRERFARSGGYLSVELKVHAPKDYFALVSYCAGDC